MLILGIESSCDETAAAVLSDGENILSNVVNSQVLLHQKYGGVVPELASRRHIETIYPVVQEALDTAGVTLNDIEALSVTQGPGLVGSLLVGFSFAKAVAYVKKIPYVGVNHMAGHILSVFLEGRKPDFPFIALVVSGGHSALFEVSDVLTFRLLGQTRDDAAGEAFDKVAKLLALGYPGGPVISRLAEVGDAEAINFPRAWLDPEGFDFSFSGIKTAVVNIVHNFQKKNKSIVKEDICAAFQEAVVEVLVSKTISAAKHFHIGRVVLTGGVAANHRLRELLKKRGVEEGIAVFMPSPELCTDNAAMIALTGNYKLQHLPRAFSLDLDVYSRSSYCENLLVL